MKKAVMAIAIGLPAIAVLFYLDWKIALCVFGAIWGNNLSMLVVRDSGKTKRRI